MVVYFSVLVQRLTHADHIPSDGTKNKDGSSRNYHRRQYSRICIPTYLPSGYLCQHVPTQPLNFATITKEALLEVCMSCEVRGIQKGILIEHSDYILQLYAYLTDFGRSHLHFFLIEF